MRKDNHESDLAWQPWASLIAACGAKPYETGSFCAAGLANRSIDAIHAAKKINRVPLNSPKS